MSTTHHIIFVDDERNALDSYARMLRREADTWRTTMFACPLEAWNFISSESIDVFITDARMPRMSGLDLLGHIRESSATQHIPVLVVTGVADGNLRRRALELGATDFLQKPIDADELLLRIRNALRQKRYEDDLRQQFQQLASRMEHAQETLLGNDTSQLGDSAREIIRNALMGSPSPAARGVILA
ncbi:MAG: response regulator [Planctomycetales bacterium]|nr:response regulator [Planctomycetales bacterium]